MRPFLLDAPTRPRRPLSLVAHAVIAWATFRIAGYAAGVRFDASSASWFWQYLDLEWLRDEPLTSLFYLHAQPPAFNALLAVGQGFPRPELFYEIVFRGLGLMMAIGMARALERLGVSRAGAISGVWVFAALPSSILYEAWLFYSLPVALLVLWSTVSFASACARRSRGSIVLFVALCALLVLGRSVFHWTWVAGTALLLATHVRARPRLRLLSVVLLVVACGALFVKNAVVFGSASSSSWLGMSLAKHTLEPLEPAERAALVEDEPPEVARLVQVLPFSELGRYPPGLRDAPVRFTGIECLVRPHKRNGQPNLNHAAYLAISEHYGRLSRRAMVRHPDVYATSVKRALLTLASPSVEYWELLPNLRKLDGWHGAVLRLGGLSRFEADDYRAFDAPYLATRVSPVYTLLTLLTLLWTVTAAVSRRGRFARRAMLRFALFTMGFVTVAQVLVEVGENHRIAYEVFPLGFALSVATLDGLAREGRRLLRRLG